MAVASGIRLVYAQCRSMSAFASYGKIAFFFFLFLFYINVHIETKLNCMRLSFKVSIDAFVGK